MKTKQIERNEAHTPMHTTTSMRVLSQQVLAASRVDDIQYYIHGYFAYLQN